MPIGCCCCCACRSKHCHYYSSSLSSTRIISRKSRRRLHPYQPSCLLRKSTKKNCLSINIVVRKTFYSTKHLFCGASASTLRLLSAISIMMMMMMMMMSQQKKVFGFTTCTSSLRFTTRRHYSGFQRHKRRRREASFAIPHTRLFMTRTTNTNREQQGLPITQDDLASSSSQPPLPLLIFAPSAYHPNTTNHNRPHSPIRTVAAPMVAASDYSFRCLVRQHSQIDACFTQMLHARNILNSRHFLQNHLDLYEYNTNNSNNNMAQLLPVQQAFLEHADQNESILAASAAVALQPIQSSHDYTTTTAAAAAAAQHGPVIVQLAGHEPTTVVQAAQIILEHVPNVAGIDLNLGCPQAIARKGMYGSFLMEHDNGLTASHILAALRNTLPEHVTVSAKIRLPLRDSDIPDRIQRLIEIGGIDFLTIHGRTLQENKTKVRACHTDKIQQAIQWAHRCNPNLPVIANGGIEFMSDIPQRLLETGASAIMSSEALLETPNVFAVDSSQHSPRSMLEQQFQMTRDYLAWCFHFPPLPGVLGQGGSLNVARGHVFKMLHRYFQEHVDLRDQLAGHGSIMKTLVQLWQLVDTLYERYVHLTDAQLANLSSSQPNSSWYRRHWEANARVHQREQPTSSADVLFCGANGTKKNDDVVRRNDSLSLEERKALIRKRIAELQRQKRNIKLPVD